MFYRIKFISRTTHTCFMCFFKNNIDNNNFDGGCLRQRFPVKSLRQWNYMSQTKKVSDWIIWCNIFWHPALFSPELISPEGSHHKPRLSGQIYSRETTFPGSKEKMRIFFDIVKMIYSVLSTKNWIVIRIEHSWTRKHHFSHQFGVTTSHTWLLKCSRSTKIKQDFLGLTQYQGNTSAMSRKRLVIKK